MSVRNARDRLPDDFVAQLYEYFSPHVADAVIKGGIKDRKTTLRVNGLKSNIRNVMNVLKDHRIKFDRVQWYEDALVLKDAKEKDISSLDIYKSGEVYLQSLSSMIPPLVLQPQPGERVLDMAAAPGSKTTQMAAIMKNEGYILANELNQVRAERLKFNIERQGVNNAEVRIGDGSQLGAEMNEGFDKVLLDAPCSGEGLFMSGQSSTYGHWSTRLVRKMVSTQRRLIESGLRCLKPGGKLVYSTCTLNPYENELLLDDVLRKVDGSYMISGIGIKAHGWLKGLTSVDGQSLSSALKNARRIIPSEIMEGFFVASIYKKK